DFVGFTPDDVDAPAIRLPARDPGSEMLIGVGDAAIVLFLEIIVRQIGVAAAAQPELLDELLAFFACFQLEKRAALFRRNDVDDVLVQPRPIRTLQLLEGLLNLLLLIFGQLLIWRRNLGSGILRWLRLLCGDTQG